MFPVKQSADRISVSLASVPPLVNHDSVNCPPGVSNAIFCDRSLWLGGEQGRVTLERIELPIDLRVDFVIRAAERPTLAVCDDAPEKIEPLMARRHPTRTDLWRGR